MNLRSLSLAALCGLPLVACGPQQPQAEKDPGDQRVEIPTPPPEGEGLQFVMPEEQVVPAGEERMFCWVPDWVPDKDYALTAFKGLQGPSGHHVVALTSGIPRAAGSVFDCTAMETMASLNPLILPDLADGKPLIPDGFAVKLAKGAKIVIQSHYVNASKYDLKIRDVAQLSLAPAGSNPTLLSYLILNDGAIDLPPHATGTGSVKCTVPRQMKVLVMLGHMHEWGRKLHVDLTRGGDTQSLYAEDNWTVEFRDKPPRKLFTPEQPLVLEQGDSLQLSCDWNNDTDKELKFPSEMCTSVSYYYPSDDLGTYVCDQ